MSNYTQFKSFFIIPISIATALIQYIVNLTKIIDLNNLTQETY